MSIEVKVPQLPESVADATLVSWHKQPGDEVKRDENLVDLETDKVVLEVPSPADGVLKEIKAEDGATVTSGELLALLDEGGESGGDEEKSGEAAAKKADGEAGEEDAAGEKGEGEEKGKDEKSGDEKEKDGEAEKEKDKDKDKEKRKDGDEDEQTDRAKRKADDGDGDRAGASEREGAGESARKLSPAVRRLIEEHDLDAERIDGSGRGGRLTKSDVMRHLESQDHDTAPEDAPPAAAARPQTGRNEERVAMTRMRARIAERMVEAQHTAAMLTTFNEVDLTEVIELRARYKEPFAEEHGVKLGFMSFFVRASIEALRKFPVVNASVEDTDIVYHDYYDIGIAVSTDRGLMVPVLRDAGRMSFAEIESAINDFGKRARDGSISLEDLTGGTFTITNGGIFGSLLSTPILNPPQSAILGMHAIQERAMVVDGEIAVRPMMYVALTYDHRIIDGREAVQFLVAVKQSLEDPARLLLQL